MKVLKTIDSLKSEIENIKKSNQTIGFVPTMGYLHGGHLSLMKEARKQTDHVIASIFVNPLQFGANEDLDQYPRNFERDELLAKEAGVDILFCPEVSEMYPYEMPMSIQVHKGTDVLCGQSRPGHFDGVATVVMKLFNLVQPSKAYFGQKDAQQVAIIMNMVQAFNVPVEIVQCPTIRESDGLAQSSRNVYLSENERAEASMIYDSLKQACNAIKNGVLNRKEVIKRVKEHLENGTGEIDYVDILTYPELEIQEKLSGKVIVAVAYRYENARLIDNNIFDIEEENRHV
ncbi:pantoate--beta-alanine ligase [Halalkalibacter sp. AB-rgal2]|uniref:pantoate--beta-alanine ligase n=1 Tax=Halalkalibacter sp. AB-rgal2 TaxID=3242695 RepID=UPI00359E4FC1